MLRRFFQKIRSVWCVYLKNGHYFSPVGKNRIEKRVCSKCGTQGLIVGQMDDSIYKPSPFGERVQSGRTRIM